MCSTKRSKQIKLFYSINKTQASANESSLDENVKLKINEEYFATGDG